MVDGETVIDLWGGHYDAERTREWEEDTIVNTYSTTKGMTAICAHQLIERGLIDLDAPVARYWPEFAACGKGEIPVRWLLSHQAGLPAVRDPLPDDAVVSWDVMTAASPRKNPGGSPARSTATTRSPTASSWVRSSVACRERPWANGSARTWPAPWPPSSTSASVRSSTRAPPIFTGA